VLQSASGNAEITTELAVPILTKKPEKPQHRELGADPRDQEQPQH
jgi:hypothetical protein